MADDLEYVKHPTLGQLAFPRDMPEEDRQKSIDYAIRQKYGLPEGTDLHAKDPETEAGKVDRNKYTNAYYEANTKVAAPQKSTRGYIPNLLQALPSGSPIGIPVYSQVKGAYDTAMQGVRGLQAARARGEPGYRQAASALAPLIGLNEEQVRRAADRGDIPGILGAVTPSAALTALPALEDRGAPLGRRAGETLPRVEEARRGGGAGAAAPPALPPGAPPPPPPPYRGPGPALPRETPPAPKPRPARPGPVQGPKLPTAEESLNVPAQQMFGKDYADLLPDQKRAAASRLGGPAGEQQTPLPTITPEVPAERRTRMGQGPGGVERRSQAERDWDESMSRAAATGQPMEGQALGESIRAARAGAPPGISEGEAWAEIMRNPEEWGRFSTAPSKTRDAMLVAAKNRLVEARAAKPGTQPLPTGPIPTPGAPGAGAAPPQEMPSIRTTPVGQLPTEQELAQQSRARATPPAAPAPTQLTPLPGANVPQGTIPAITLDEALRRATGQPEPAKPKPGVPLGEQLGKE